MRPALPKGGRSPTAPYKGGRSPVESSTARKRPSPPLRGPTKQAKPAVEHGESLPARCSATDGKKEDLSSYKRPSWKWNGRRAAYDAVLPHGEGWSAPQIEWFVGLWWKHLANASVSRG